MYAPPCGYTITLSAAAIIEPKLFIGNLPRNITAESLTEVLRAHASVDQVVLLNRCSPSGKRSAFAFLQDVSSCKLCIDALHGTFKFPGSDEWIVVRFADKAVQSSSTRQQTGVQSNCTCTSVVPTAQGHGVATKLCLLVACPALHATHPIQQTQTPTHKCKATAQTHTAVSSGKIL